MKHNIIRKIYHIATVLLATGVLTSCADDTFATAGTIPGAGESDVTILLGSDGFATAVAAASRGTAGDAVSGVDDVCVMAYSAASGSLAGARHYARGAGLAASAADGCDTLSLTLPYGRYRIYTVANLGDITSLPEAATEAGLRAMRVDWNGADIPANRQMAGVVTASVASASMIDREAPVVEIGRDTRRLHSWLQRSVSKVTVAFDATELNDNVYIYICSAQLRDIPVECTLLDRNVPQLPADGGDNLPASQCLTQGPSISWLATAGDYESSRVMLARGSAYGGLDSEDSLRPGDNVHRHDEESLFFYENMQGTHRDKHLYQNFPSKDSVAYGTYLEVKAFYHNKGPAPSRGEITYRYMLGMNDTDDFNAQRNTHYRVTLRFRGDANDPDWHIDYKRPDKPTVEIPTPLHISYLYNQRLDMPVACYFDDTNYSLEWVDAEIVSNPYTHSGHEYAQVTSASFAGKTFDWTRNQYGFLSFNKHENITNIDMTKASAYQGSVRCTDLPAYDPAARGVHFTIPVYTRPLNLMVPDASGTLADLGFSGNNHFTHRERRARVKITAQLRNLADNSLYTITDYPEVEILQVKRVVNPKGVWRAHNSTKPFTFTLMETDKDATNVSSIEESSVAYTPIRSFGPWTARVYTENYWGEGSEFKPGSDWIELSPKGASRWMRGLQAQVTGATNSLVEFDFRPTSTIPEGQTRFGVIEVLYHDNQCRHLIFVSQGYGTVEMGASGTRWMMGNLYANGTEVANPLMEGSMFKYGNAGVGIRASNNYSMSDPDRPAGPFKDARSVELQCARRTYSGGAYSDLNESYTAKFGAISADLINGFASDPGLKRSATGTGTYRVATYADYQELLDTRRFGTLFGVLYGEECSSTLDWDVDRYTDADDRSGMRGCFIYDRGTGRHLFLPIGNTGNGRRKATFDNGSKSYAVLKYANRDALMPTSVATPRPLMYDIYRKPGALYWFESAVKEGSTRHYALDINYFTYLVNVYDTQVLYYYGSSNDSRLTEFKRTRPLSGWADQNSDAAFLRRIRVD